MSDTPDKTELRRALRARRRVLAAQIPDAAERIAAALPAGRLQAAEAFSGYHPLGSEIDPRPLMRRLAELGLVAALPVAEDRHSPLEFRVWDAGEALVPDAFGIPAPPLWADAVLPDLVLAPVLGFDARGHRLGQGAGHYDRTLAQLRAVKPVLVVGLAFSGQEVAELPAEPHDQRLDAILTETGWREFG